MDFKNLLIEKAGGVATLTINRPQSLNALNREVITELSVPSTGWNRMPLSRSLIVTGAGDKGLCGRC